MPGLVPLTLYTFDGREVAQVTTLPWMQWPEVFFWGLRVFIRRTGPDGAFQYREADGVAAIVGDDGYIVSDSGQVLNGPELAASRPSSSAPRRNASPTDPKPGDTAVLASVEE